MQNMLLANTSQGGAERTHESGGGPSTLCCLRDQRTCTLLVSWSPELGGLIMRSFGQPRYF